MKQVIAFIFLLAFAMQTFSRAIIVWDYALNTKAYAKNCENKARPQMHCNGKCQMMKKLQEQEKKDQQNSERKAENKSELIFAYYNCTPTNNLIYTKISRQYPAKPAEKEIKISSAIFHPPAVARFFLA